MGLPIIALAAGAALTILGARNQINSIRASKKAALFGANYDYEVGREKRYSERLRAFQNWRAATGKRGVSYTSASNYTQLAEFTMQAERENKRMLDRYTLQRNKINATAAAQIAGVYNKAIVSAITIGYSGYNYLQGSRLAAEGALNTGFLQGGALSGMPGYSGATFTSLGGATPATGNTLLSGGIY